MHYLIYATHHTKRIKNLITSQEQTWSIFCIVHNYVSFIFFLCNKITTKSYFEITIYLVYPCPNKILKTYYYYTLKKYEDFRAIGYGVNRITH